MDIRLLTIGVLVCDNDTDLLGGFLPRLDRRVKVPHEIVVWDNTVEKSLPPLPDSVRVISRGMGEWKENVRQFEGRKGVALAARGDWVWYVDPDDDVFEVDEGFVPPCVDGDVDCVMFGFKVGKLDYRASHWPHAIEDGGRPRTFDWRDLHVHGFAGALWDRWIRADRLRSAYAMFKMPLLMSFWEDVLVEQALLREPLRVWLSDRMIYDYNKATSVSCFKSMSGGDDARRFMVGFRAYVSETNMMFTYAEQLEMLSLCGGSAKAFAMGTIRDRLCASILAHPEKTGELVSVAREAVGDDGALRAAVKSYRGEVDDGDMLTWLSVERRALAEIPGDGGAGDLPIRFASFLFSYKCDEACPYCYQRGMKDGAELGDEELYARFDSALAYMEGVCRADGARLVPQIMGGEPTLMSPWLSARVCARLAEYPMFQLLTNGGHPDTIWYKSDNCRTVTHLVHWAETLDLSPREGGGDAPMAVVAHGEADRLGEALDKSGWVERRFPLSVRFCEGGRPLACDDDDKRRVGEVLAARGALGALYANGLDEGEKDLVAGYPWLVDLTRADGVFVSPCCASDAEPVPLSAVAPGMKADCEKCGGREGCWLYENQARRGEAE